MRATGFEVSPEVADAVSTGHAVVALESTLIAHGLPAADRRDVARQIEQTVRDRGAVPATIGVVRGRLIVGLTHEQLDRLATGDPVKLSLRDLAPALALGRDGATTVASTAPIAAAAGIRVFATGGLGGVHRGARESWDESADLVALSQTPIAVVCSGVKSILDVTATLERMESLSIGLVGYGTDRFPGFYLSDSGHPVRWRADSPEEVAAMIRARDSLSPARAALVVANPLPHDRQLDPELHERVLAAALTEAASAGIAGKDITPYLLERFHQLTEGRSVRANVQIILRNAALAAQIAVAGTAA